MRRSFLCLALGGLLVATAIAAELVITSFHSNGELTWTNSFTNNATYRVEWAGSAAGPWQKFDALTNLTLLSATSNAVTVKVPIFYRVIWLDAPPHTGTYNYSEFDTNGSLTTTGRFTLSAGTNPITGTWKFSGGSGVIRGFITNSSLGLDLRPDVIDSQYRLGGQLTGNTYTGVWIRGNFAGQYFRGTFRAEKQGVAP